MSETENEGLLSRWSRRKLEAREQLQIDESLEQNDLSDTALTGGLEEVEVPEEPVLTDEDMPPIESLTEDSDFSQFMSPGVSDKLRNLALRKMFHVPSFNIRDGLDEYDEDYTFFEPLGDIVTCDMKHQMEMLEKKKQEAEEALAEEEVDDIEDEIEDEVEDDDDEPEAVEPLTAETDEEIEMNEVKGNE